VVKLVVLLSGSGSNLQTVIDAIAAGRLNARIAAVISDRADAYGLQRALQANLPAVCLPLPGSRDAAERARLRAAWETQLAELTAVFAPDLVLLSGFMRILTPRFLSRFPERVINQHPALLPADGGEIVHLQDGRTIPALRGAHVVADAVTQQLPVSGCTIHYVTPIVDAGPLLGTREVPLLPGDDAATLHARIKTAEHELLLEVLGRLCTAA
jgi:phosphoribosylglycinamide formyltransferase-1